MILSVSRRTDIPAFFSEWFFNRLREGYVMVRNPMNPRQVSKIPINPKVVDCIVFWTKNPGRMIERLPLLEGYYFYFQFTLTPYGNEFEKNLPPKEELIHCFQELSRRVGKERVIWRHDPIFLSEDIDFAYHQNHFADLASGLKDYTKRCVISFIDPYAKIQKRIRPLKIRELNQSEMRNIGEAFAEIARRNKIEIVSCAEEIDLTYAGIQHGKCIDDQIISEITGSEIHIAKDPAQRKQCGCVTSIDIGVYNTCKNDCLYCYANSSTKIIETNIRNHQPSSPLLLGGITKEDRITIREAHSCLDSQKRFSFE